MDASLGACSGVLWDLAAVDWGFVAAAIEREELNKRSINDIAR